MSITSMSFDLIVVSLMGDFIVDNKMFRSCLMMIGYREMLVNLVFLDL